MRDQLKDSDRLAHMIEAIDNLKAFMHDKSPENLEENKILYFAVVKNIEIVGEAAYKLSMEFKNNHPEIPWRLIEKMRHIMVHGYYKISLPILYNVYTEDLPILESFIKNLNVD